ncbi:MAG: HEAT repeat domain-containing protein [Terracidiphilus sp.]|nr:HEAT repeat domain-containing protein [Terracidiphilus sp.]MDR3776792.1 HEAT repeat domain-containing protein [Terracidiphilus sp.]
MNCEVAQERIVTAAYGELPDEQAHELEQHLAGCAECQGDREQLLALKLLAEAYPVREPDANLVARSRQRLEEALDALPPMRWYERLSQQMRNSLASLQAVPVAASLLLVLGAGAGSLGGFELAQHRAVQAAAAQTAQAAKVQAEATAAAPAETASIANISSIVRQPNSQMVEVRYNQVVPQRIQGSLNDPAIRQLLMLASENSASAGVRDDSVGLLAAECKAGHSCQAAGIRDALMVSLRYDKNAGVREKALQGLEPYVAEDVRVRDAVLEALMNDSDPRIRTAAINILEPVEADTSVRQVLHTVANSDRNPYIRTVSRQVLSRVPEIQ